MPDDSVDRHATTARVQFRRLNRPAQSSKVELGNSARSLTIRFQVVWTKFKDLRQARCGDLRHKIVAQRARLNCAMIAQLGAPFFVRGARNSRANFAHSRALREIVSGRTGHAERSLDFA